MKLPYILILFVSILIVYSSVQAAEVRYALVIGNAGYPSAPLSNPVNDATDMAAQLEQRNFKPGEATLAQASMASPGLANASLQQELNRCQQYLQTNSLISGNDGNAFGCYRSILENDPANTEARAGLATIVGKYQDLATNATKRGRTIQAQDLLAKAEMVWLFIKALPQPEPTPTPPTPTPTHPTPTPTPTPVPPLSSWTDFVGQLAAFLTGLATLLGVIWQFWRHRSIPKDIDVEIPYRIAQLTDEKNTGEVIFTQPIVLNKPQIRIGRTANNDLVINRETISSAHAVIQFVDGQFQVEDLHSGNGTSVNGKRLAAHQPKQLASGDVISFDVYQFRFVLGTILRG